MPYEESTRVKRFLNQQGAYEGAGLPPYPMAGQRIPAPSGFAINYIEPQPHGVRVVVGWNVDPSSPALVYRLNVYANNGLIRWSLNQNVNDYTTELDRSMRTAQIYITKASTADLFIPCSFSTQVTIALGAQTTGGIISLDELSSTVSFLAEPLGDSWVKTYTAAAVALRYDQPELALCDATAAPQTVTLPRISGTIHGQRYTVKKIDASANAVTVVPEVAAELIDGAANSIITVRYTALTYVADRGTNLWWII